MAKKPLIEKWAQGRPPPADLRVRILDQAAKDLTSGVWRPIESFSYQLAGSVDLATAPQVRQVLAAADGRFILDLRDARQPKIGLSEDERTARRAREEFLRAVSDPAADFVTAVYTPKVEFGVGAQAVRVDFVDSGDSIGYWVSARIDDSDRIFGLWAEARSERGLAAEVVRADGSLATLAGDEPERSVVVVRTSGVAGAVDAAIRIVENAEDDPPVDLGRLDVTATLPEPGVASRRRAMTSEAARLSARKGGGGRRHPIAGSCDHCGQPLSDPTSLMYGVGPECRKYYDVAVLKRVARNDRRSRLPVFTPSAWASEMLSYWTRLENP